MDMKSCSIQKTLIETDKENTSILQKEKTTIGQQSLLDAIKRDINSAIGFLKDNKTSIIGVGITFSITAIGLSIYFFKNRKKII